MKVYFYEGYSGKKEDSRKLLLRVLEMYCISEGIEPVKAEEIMETEKGKPYAAGKNIYFSVSHSGILWSCAVSDRDVGLDIQIAEGHMTEKISERYFSEEERHYVDLWGTEGFYSLWTMKEAYCKLSGESIFRTVSDVSFAENGCLADRAGDVFLTEIEISPDIKCSVAEKGCRSEIEIIPVN